MNHGDRHYVFKHVGDRVSRSFSGVNDTRGVQGYVIRYEYAQEGNSTRRELG